MDNPYYSPEKFDLTPIGELEFSDGDYVFDTRVVWQHKSGKLYTARSSGCSCPIPFEEYPSLESLDAFDLESLKREIATDLGTHSISKQSDAQELIEKIRAL